MNFLKKPFILALSLCATVYFTSCSEQSIKPSEDISSIAVEDATTSLATVERDSTNSRTFSFFNKAEDFVFRGRFAAGRPDSLGNIPFRGVVVDSLTNQRFRLLGQLTRRTGTVNLDVINERGVKLYTYAQGRLVRGRGIRGQVLVIFTGNRPTRIRQVWTARRLQ